MRQRHWREALLWVLFILALAARAEAVRVQLSVPVHGFSHVAFYAAKEKGYFQEEGLDVEVILMSGAIGIRALIAGDVDASTVGGSALPPILRGAPFRDTEGRVGLIDEFCAHRRASLFLGRNKEGGLRCVYHGWKYDTKGNCLDMPSEPEETNFKHKIRLKAYPTVEMGGVIWAYMGPPEKVPPLPKFEWTQVPENYRHLSKIWQECNWLQALEGAIDNAHAAFLHRALTDKTTRAGLRGHWENSAAPRLDVHLTDYGFMYTATRALPGRENYVRAYQYVMPFHQFFPSQITNSGSAAKLKKPTVRGHMFVPMDDENSMVYNWTYTFGEQPLTEADMEQLGRHIGSAPDELTADFRKVRSKDNDWLIDRQVQKTETYSGIEGITTQDHAIQESMGPIVDRSREHLGSTDKAIIAARRLLLEATKTVLDGGDPPGLGESYYSIRAIERVLPDGKDVLVLRCSGVIYAIQRRCPHEGAPLEKANVWNKMIRCGQHAFTFDLETGEGLNCTGYKIERYAVAVEDGKIFSLIEGAKDA